MTCIPVNDIVILSMRLPLFLWSFAGAATGGSWMPLLSSLWCVIAWSVEQTARGCGGPTRGPMWVPSCCWGCGGGCKPPTRSWRHKVSLKGSIENRWRPHAPPLAGVYARSSRPTADDDNPAPQNRPPLIIQSEHSSSAYKRGATNPLLSCPPFIYLLRLLFCVRVFSLPPYHYVTEHRGQKAN